MEASALTHAARGGLLRRRSPLLRLQGDEMLVALIRAGDEHAFEALFERYHSRLLAFCRHMLRSTEDAEDVLQEVFVKAHAAMLADERPINARPWLYRIARNRCLNHLRRPVPEGHDSMDVMTADGGVTTADRVQKREEFRALVIQVGELPETQRTALLLREIDALSYEEIAAAMDTTVPAVKSLLVRARISLADATQSRQLTCGEVRLELAEAAEGLRKASGPVRHHVKGCEQCREFRRELRTNDRALAALSPLGPLALFHEAIIAKLSALFGGSSAATGSGAAGVAAVEAAGGSAVGGAAAAGAGAAGGGAALGAGAAAGGIGGALGAKAAATAATAALLTAGAVEVRDITASEPATEPTVAAAQPAPVKHSPKPVEVIHVQSAPATELAPRAVTAEPVAPTTEPAPAPTTEPESEGVVGPASGGEGKAGNVEPITVEPAPVGIVVTPGSAPPPASEPTTAPPGATPAEPQPTPGQDPVASLAQTSTALLGAQP